MNTIVSFVKRHLLLTMAALGPLVPQNSVLRAATGNRSLALYDIGSHSPQQGTSLAHESQACPIRHSAHTVDPLVSLRCFCYPLPLRDF